MSTELDKLLIRFNADIDAVVDGVREVDREIDKVIETVSSKLNQLGETLMSAGKKLSAYVTAPIVANAGLAVYAADQQIQAEEKLAASIRMAGEEVTGQMDLLKEYASQLQKISTVGDEVTLANMQMGRSLGLSSLQAANAAKNAIGMAKAFGINERAAIRMTAMLEQGNTSMLARYMPTLRSLETETERAAEAQRLLGEAFGVARREAEVGLGPWKQLKNDIGDLYEQYGELILGALEPFAKSSRVVVSMLQEMSKETKISILIFSGLAAAIGPGLIALGLMVKMIGISIAALGGLKMALLAPVAVSGIAIASMTAGWILFGRTMGVVAEGTHRTIRAWLVERFTNNIQRPFIEKLNEAIGAVPLAARLLSGLKKIELPPEVAGSIGQEFSAAFGAAKEAAFRDVDEIRSSFASLSEAAQAAFASMVPKGVQDTLSKIFSGMNTDVDGVLDRLKELEGGLAEFGQGVEDATEGAVGGVGDLGNDIEEVSAQVAAAARELSSAFGRAFESAIVDGGKFSDILRSLEQDILRVFVRQAIIAPIMGTLFGGGAGGGAGLFGGLFSAKGNAFSNGHHVMPFAKGGLISGPVAFPLGVAGEGNRPEAILPLQRTQSGDLGVLSIGGGGGKVQVNVYAPPGSSVEQTQDHVGDLTRINVMIDQANAQNINSEGSATSRALRNKFGIKPTLVGR